MRSYSDSSRRPCRVMPILAAVLAAFCAARVAAGAAPAPLYTQEEARQMLRAELDAFERYASSTMDQARDVLRRRGVGAQELAKVESWQKVQKERLQTALRQDDPLAALVDAWAVSESMFHFADEHAASSELPASAREVVLDILGKRRDRLAQLARAYLPPDSIPTLTASISAFADSAPLPDGDAQRTNRTAETSWMFSMWQKGQSAAKGVLSIPLSPVRAMTGIGEGGKALSDMRDTTAQAIEVAEQLPERIRREVEILLETVVREHEALGALLHDIHGISTNVRVTAEQAHATAAAVQESLDTARVALPAGESLAAAVERAARASTELVNAVTGLVAQTGSKGQNEGAGSGDGFEIAEYQQTAEAIRDAAIELRELMMEIRLLTEAGKSDAPKDKDGPGFDIREYRAAAEAIERATGEIRGVLGDVRDLGRDGRLQGRTAVLLRAADRSAERAADQAERLVDHIFWRLIQLAVVICLLALFVAARKRRLQDQARAAKGTK